ncbi:MAG: hypothetical protein K2H03_00590 [Muribaculaceae bacterium]|nr:hypothetical protein [Muribaculaceae bacterium]MDE5928954.1 hypothetical protein [Muribaculaceae bacterium]
MLKLLDDFRRAYRREALDLDELRRLYERRNSILDRRPELAPLFEDIDDEYHISPRLDSMARGGNAEAERIAWHYLVVTA